MIENKPKARVFTKKKRGTRKFIAEHHNLIRNEAQQAGLLEYDRARMGYVMPKVVSPEMLEVAKAAQQRAKKGSVSSKSVYNILKGEIRPAKKNSEWVLFWSAIELYDRTHKSTVTLALKAWLESQPAVRKLKNKARIEALTVAATRMIAHLDKQAGRDSTKNLVTALNTDRQVSNLLPIYISEANQCQTVAPVLKRTKTKNNYSVVYQHKQVSSLPLSIA